MAKTNHFGVLAAVAGMLAAVGLLMLMLVVVDARRAEATFPGLPGNFAYTGFDGTDTEIYTITPGGGIVSNSPTTLRLTPSLPTRLKATRSHTQASTLLEPMKRSTPSTSAEGSRSKSLATIRTTSILPGEVGSGSCFCLIRRSAAALESGARSLEAFRALCAPGCSSLL
jgi:hypothetical protein